MISWRRREGRKHVRVFADDLVRQVCFPHRRGSWWRREDEVTRRDIGRCSGRGSGVNKLNLALSLAPFPPRDLAACEVETGLNGDGDWSTRLDDITFRLGEISLCTRTDPRRLHRGVSARLLAVKVGDRSDQHGLFFLGWDSPHAPRLAACRDLPVRSGALNLLFRIVRIKMEEFDRLTGGALRIIFVTLTSPSGGLLSARLPAGGVVCTKSLKWK